MVLPKECPPVGREDALGANDSVPEERGLGILDVVGGVASFQRGVGSICSGVGVEDSTVRVSPPPPRPASGIAGVSL